MGEFGSSPDPAPGIEHRNLALDGLRGVAILLVLMYHLTPGRDLDRGIEVLGFKIAAAGWMGVDLFFVLSGFLITSLLLASLGKPDYFRNFYIRRTLRVFPLYYVALIGTLLIFPLLTRWPVPELRTQLPYWLYYRNFVWEPLDLPLHLGHFWSLAIEEQFYLVWPAIVLASGRRGLRFVCLTLILISPLVRASLLLSGHGWEATYGWTCSRVDALAAGALLAVLPRRSAFRGEIALAWACLASGAALSSWWIWRSKTGLMFREIEADGIGIATSLVFTTRTLLLSFLAIMFASAVFLALRRAFPVPIQRVLETRPLRVFGKYSYAIYVLHYLLTPLLERHLLPFIRELGPLFEKTQLGIWTYFLVVTLASLGLARLSWLIVESPMLHLKDRLAPRKPSAFMPGI